jgi:hypothetical protein
VYATLAWQVATGAPDLLFAGNPYGPAIDRLRDVTSLPRAARVLAEPLLERPEALAGGLALAVAALAVPLVLRAPPGSPRVVAALLWSAGLATLLQAAPGAGPRTLGAVLPACVVVVVWALRPWQILLGTGSRTRSATLREPAP